jgi:hypothetical protein
VCNLGANLKYRRFTTNLYSAAKKCQVIML